MKISARNVIRGKVKSVVRDEVNAEVILAIGGGAEIVSHISARSVDVLELAEGKAAYAVIKINNVMIATP